MRRAAKVDANQADVVSSLRAVGATVTHLHAVGQGCPDILVGFRGLNVLMEIKDGDKPPSRRKLTPQQVEWHDAWKGQVHVVNDKFEAVALLMELTKSCD